MKTWKGEQTWRQQRKKNIFYSSDNTPWGVKCCWRGCIDFPYVLVSVCISLKAMWVCVCVCVCAGSVSERIGLCLCSNLMNKRCVRVLIHIYLVNMALTVCMWVYVCVYVCVFVCVWISVHQACSSRVWYAVGCRTLLIYCCVLHMLPLLAMVSLGAAGWWRGGSEPAPVALNISEGHFHLYNGNYPSH